MNDEKRMDESKLKEIEGRHAVAMRHAMAGPPDAFTLVGEDIPVLVGEVRRLRKLTDGTPLAGCEKCSFSARPKDIIKGMCPDCAERRIEWLENWQRRAAELFNEPDMMLRLEQWKRVRMLLSGLEGKK